MSKVVEYVQPASMTFWTGIAAIGFGIARIVSGEPVDSGIESILGGLTAIFLRRAISNP